MRTRFQLKVSRLWSPWSGSSPRRGRPCSRRAGWPRLCAASRLGVVRAGDVDAAAVQAGLDVLGAVHLGRPTVGGEPGEDQDLLEGEARDLRQPPRVSGIQSPAPSLTPSPRPSPVNLATDRSPSLSSVRLCLRALRCCRGAWCRARRSVDVVEALVVTHVGHDAAVAVDDDVGALVLEAPHGGVLDRRRGRVHGVDLDDPAEPVGLVGVSAVAAFQRGSTCASCGCPRSR